MNSPAPFRKSDARPGNEVDDTPACPGEAVVPAGAMLLEKPFVPDSLLEAVRGAMGSSQSLTSAAVRRSPLHRVSWGTEIASGFSPSTSTSHAPRGRYTCNAMTSTAGGFGQRGQVCIGP